MIQRASEGTKKGISESEFDLGVLFQGGNVPYLTQELICLHCGTRFTRAGNLCLSCEADFFEKYGHVQVDFFIPVGRRGICVFVNGSVHETEKREKFDKVQVELLEKLGYGVARITNKQLRLWK